MMDQVFLQGTGGMKVLREECFVGFIRMHISRLGISLQFPNHGRLFHHPRGIFLAGTNTQTLGNVGEPILVFVFKIPQKIPSLPYKFQQTTPGIEILRLFPEMICEVDDPFRQQGDLNFWRTGIIFLASKLLDDFGFTFFRYHKSCSLLN